MARRASMGTPEGRWLGTMAQRTSRIGTSVSGFPPPWFSRTSRGSCRQQNAPSQQVEAGAAVALPFQQLEVVDLPLGLAAVPGLDQGGAHRGGAWRAGTFPPGGPHAARVALERYPVPAALPDVLAGLKVMNDVSIAYECEKAIC